MLSHSVKYNLLPSIQYEESTSSVIRKKCALGAYVTKKYFTQNHHDSWRSLSIIWTPRGEYVKWRILRGEEKRGEGRKPRAFTTNQMPAFPIDTPSRSCFSYSARCLPHLASISLCCHSYRRMSALPHLPMTTWVFSFKRKEKKISISLRRME